MNMQERKDPKFVNFAEGEVVEGVLYSIDQIMFRDKETGEQRRGTQFVLLDGEVIGDVFKPNGELTCFNGTHQINAKLLMTDRGKYVRVRCEGSDPNAGRNGNALKLFKVSVSEEQMSVAEKNPLPRFFGDGSSVATSVGITDADIPF